MKYLNTKYPSLFDASANCGTDTTYNVIKNNSTYPDVYVGYCTKNISSTIATTSIYVKFLYQKNGGTGGQMLNINTVGGVSLLVSSSSTQLLFTDSNNNFSWTVEVPSEQVRVNNTNLHQRVLTVHFDTVENIVEVWSNGIYYGSTSCGNSGEDILSVSFGNINARNNNQYMVNFADVLISENAIPPNEGVSEVSPTITSTAWTVSSGTAATNTVGASMTLTAPSGSIDETTRSVTGYGVAFLDASSATTINALNVTQGATTKQVLLPSSGAVETADTFTILQASDISATAVAAYVSQ